MESSGPEEGVGRRRFLRTVGTTGVALGVVAWATPMVQTTVPAWAATGSGGPGDGSPGSGSPGAQGSGGLDVHGGDTSQDRGDTGDGQGATDGDSAVNAHTPADPSAAALEADRTAGAGTPAEDQGTVGAGAHANDQGTVGAASAHAAVDPRVLVAFGGGAIAVGSAAVGTSNRLVKPHHSTHDTPPEDHPDTSGGPA